MENRTILRVLMLLVLVAFIMGCAVTHKYGHYQGKVVDAETKEPLEGAAVLAVYYTLSPSPGGPVSHFLDAKEAVTDKNGEFKIPSDRIWTFRPLQVFEPYAWFRIFKPEYGCYPNHKDVKPMFLPNGSLPANQHVTIELPRLRTREERIKNYGCYPSEVVPEIKYKNLFLLIQQERMELGLEPRKIPK